MSLNVFLSLTEYVCWIKRNAIRIAVVTKTVDIVSVIVRGKRVKENKQIYIKLASHCIGLDHKNPYKRHGRLFYRPYRNYYDASAADCEIWDVMVGSGYAEAGRKDRNGGRMYWMTRAGLDWLGEKLGIHIWDEEE